ncbi:cupredoxin family copper-binding protein [Paenibacillus sp.]|uniref:cupredoxin domain-containing protein n=1 Tax=Paenibacillus sp. TaxID=58172 RepID=UPI002811DE15|nr:cupredoxin family copper-binding protein [Paenibacillus sp.]
MSRWKYAARSMSIVLLLFAAACSSAGGDGSTDSPTASAEQPEVEESAEHGDGEPHEAPAEPAAAEPATSGSSTGVEAPMAEKPAKTEAPAAEPPEDPAEEPAEQPGEKPVEKPAAQPAPDPAPSPAKAEPVRHVVEIVDFAFSPDRLEINAGDTVVFANKDAVGHTATAEDGSFDTGILKQGEEMEVTFAEAGEFPYICTPHPGMKAIILVK